MYHFFEVLGCYPLLRERERERERESCLFVVGGPENVLYRELVFSEVREVICTLIFRLLKLKPDLNV